MSSRHRHDPVQQAREKRQRAWWTFRRRLGLADTDQVARLLGVSVRSIQRYESAVQPPAWYQAALLGLIETFPEHPVARRFRPKKRKKTGRASDTYVMETLPRSPYTTWDPKYYRDVSTPR